MGFGAARGCGLWLPHDDYLGRVILNLACSVISK